MNPDTNSPEPILPPAPSSKRQLMLSLTAIGMGLAAAAFLLTRPRIHAPATKAVCDSCAGSETSATKAASKACAAHAAPTHATAANTSVKKTGVPHE